MNPHHGRVCAQAFHIRLWTVKGETSCRHICDMNKRTFLKLSGIVGAGALVSPWMGCGESTEQATPEKLWGDNPFTLPELGFPVDALAPAIDAETMAIHHGKHHAGYVRKLNAALSGQVMQGDGTLESLLRGVDPLNEGVRNNGGGHFNHTLYWEVMAPSGGNQPGKNLSELIARDFGSFESFAEQFATAAAKQFGSGWAWLSLTDEGSLVVSSTPNQDNPLMSKCVDQPGTPILGIDVWEHAYYLNYQNRRKDYIAAFVELINWDAVDARLAHAVRSIIRRVRAGS